MFGGSARAVVLALAAVQGTLCLTAVALSQVGMGFAIGATIVFAAAGGYAIFVLETPGRGRLATASRTLPAESAAPENSAA
jgi:hypothetical protein